MDVTDTVEGRGYSPALVLCLVESLPDDSLVHASYRGDLGSRGWGEDRLLLAGVYNLLGLLVRAAGHWRDKPPDIPNWQLPESFEKNSRKSKFAGGLKGLAARFGQII